MRLRFLWLALACSGGALAQPAELGPYRRPATLVDAAQPTDARPPPRVRVTSLPRRHDGWWLRFAAGGGLAFDRPDSSKNLGFEVDTNDEGYFSGSMQGGAGATEIAVGYTVTPGLVLGAGIDTTSIFRGETSGVNVGQVQYVYQVSQLAVVGPVLALYPWPTRGLVLQGIPGLGSYIAGQGNPKERGPRARAHETLGFGFSAGAGWEWFVADEWSMGLLLRYSRAWTSGTDDDGVDWEHTPSSVVGLVTVSQH